jgi:4-carboxymuconolactone decarboxylase
MENMSSSSHPLEHVQRLLDQHPEDAEMILLSALSVCWLEPQSPLAADLLKIWQQKQLPMKALREAALQLFLISGFQVSLEAFHQIQEVLGTTPEGHCENLERDSTGTWFERGLTLQERVYAQNTAKLRKNLARLSPELAQWTVLIGYGLVLSRPDLDAGTRELLEVAVLIAKGFPRQLHSHYRGALNLGISVEKIDLLLEVVEVLVLEERILSARQLWNDIRAKLLP